jgi:hypothetical protein
MRQLSLKAVSEPKLVQDLECGWIRLARWNGYAA